MTYSDYCDGCSPFQVTILHKVSRCLAFSRKWVGNQFHMAKWTLIYRVVEGSCGSGPWPWLLPLNTLPSDMGPSAGWPISPLWPRVTTLCSLAPYILLNPKPPTPTFAPREPRPQGHLPRPAMGQKTHQVLWVFKEMSCHLLLLFAGFYFIFSIFAS